MLGPTEQWSIREKLCLASSVMKSGDQNWWFFINKKKIDSSKLIFVFTYMPLLSVVLSLFDFKAPNVHNNIQRPYNLSVACDLLDTD